MVCMVCNYVILVVILVVILHVVVFGADCDAVVVYKKAYDINSEDLILVRHQPLPQNHKNTNPRV